ncbi:BMP family ABC transporter substrate-binding protein, partial [Salmonella enterica]|nr:BMP family ABC transporter substrate-binding protein [Salmonella enterica]
MPNLAATAAIGSVAVLTLAACGGTGGAGGSAAGQNNGGGNSASSGSNYFIYVTPNPLGGNSFLQLGAEGVAAAAKAHNARTKTYESTDAATIADNVNAAVSDGATIVIGISSDMVEPMDNAAKANPDNKFVMVDAC